MKTSLLMDFAVDRINNRIRVKREFAAPVSKVWAAWTESELLDQWWAPKPWKAQTKIMDFRVGGHWLYAMVGPDGSRHWSRADFKSIEQLKNFTGYDAFCDENGNIDKTFPTARWSNSFHENNEVTEVTVELQYEALADLEKYIEMGFREGFTAALENLDGLL